jgi:hypothetical protein
MLFPQVCALQYPDRIKWGLNKEGNDEAYGIDLSFWFGISALVCMFIMSIICPRIYLPYIAFTSLAILQWSALIPVTQILSDRYCSLPNVFMMFFLSYFVSLTGIFYIPIIIGFMAYYLVCLSVVMPMYRNLTSYYEYHFKYYPHLSWYRHCLIQDLMSEGKVEEAKNQTLQGLLHDKNDYKLLIWGCLMCIIKGDLINAETFVNEAEKNMYLNREEEQSKEIAYYREQLANLKPIEKKAKYLTEREKAILLKKKGVKRFNEL